MLRRGDLGVIKPGFLKILPVSRGTAGALLERLLSASTGSLCETAAYRRGGAVLMRSTTRMAVVTPDALAKTAAPTRPFSIRGRFQPVAMRGVLTSDFRVSGDNRFGVFTIAWMLFLVLRENRPI